MGLTDKVCYCISIDYLIEIPGFALSLMKGEYYGNIPVCSSGFKPSSQ